VTTPLLLVAFGPMLAEAWRSAAHERRLRASGAVEPAGDVYAAMQVVYPVCFLVMIGEGWLHGYTAAAIPTGAVVFGAAKALKYWAIQTLGPRWTFRVLVPPDSRRIERGPYRVMRHPNYVGVLGELAGFALLAGAPRAGLASVIVFGVLLLLRIRVEERAMSR
jgi:methyltransferase